MLDRIHSCEKDAFLSATFTMLLVAAQFQSIAFFAKIICCPRCRFKIQKLHSLQLFCKIKVNTNISIICNNLKWQYALIAIFLHLNNNLLSKVKLTSCSERTYCTVCSYHPAFCLLIGLNTGNRSACLTYL